MKRHQKGRIRIDVSVVKRKVGGIAACRQSLQLFGHTMKGTCLCETSNLQLRIQGLDYTDNTRWKTDSWAYHGLRAVKREVVVGCCRRIGLDYVII